MKYGRCIVARKIDYRDAYILHRRLFCCGFTTSVIIAGSKDMIPEKEEEYLPCKNGHLMKKLLPIGVQGDITPNAVARKYCNICQHDIHDEFVMGCTTCDYDVCWVCFCIMKDLPCKVLFGKFEGTFVSYPPQEEGDTAAPPQRLTDVNTQAMMLIQAASDSATSNTNAIGTVPEDLINVLSQLLRGGNHNKKPGTKPSVLKNLVRKTVGVDEIKDLPEDCCVICMNDFLKGDSVINLPCGHWFHAGEDSYACSKPNNLDASSMTTATSSSDYATLTSDASDLCDGIIPWLKKNNDCKFKFNLLQLTFVNI